MDNWSSKHSNLDSSLSSSTNAYNSTTNKNSIYEQHQQTEGNITKCHNSTLGTLTKSANLTIKTQSAYGQ